MRLFRFVIEAKQLFIVALGIDVGSAIEYPAKVLLLLGPIAYLLVWPGSDGFAEVGFEEINGCTKGRCTMYPG